MSDTSQFNLIFDSGCQKLLASKCVFVHTWSKIILRGIHPLNHFNFEGRQFAQLAKNLPYPYLSLAIYPSDWRKYHQWSVLPGCGGRTGKSVRSGQSGFERYAESFLEFFLGQLLWKRGHLVQTRGQTCHFRIESTGMYGTYYVPGICSIGCCKKKSTALMTGGIMPGVGIFLFPLVKMMFCETSGCSWTPVRLDRLWRKKTQPTRCNCQSSPNFIKSTGFLVPKHQPSDRSFLPDSGILPGSEQFGQLNLSTIIGPNDILWFYRALKCCLKFSSYNFFKHWEIYRNTIRLAIWLSYHHGSETWICREYVGCGQPMNLSGQYFSDFLGRQNVGIEIAGLNSLVSTDE